MKPVKKVFVYKRKSCVSLYVSCVLSLALNADNCKLYDVVSKRLRGVFLACEQALCLAGIVKSGRTRGTREETRRQGRGRERPLGPSRLRRSLMRSRAARFARPNRRACSQATVLRDTIIISLYPPYVLGL